MYVRGGFAPERESAAADRYDELGATAQLVVREVAMAMGMDAEEYDDRVTEDVVATAREVLFAENLAIRVADRGAFDDWCAEYDGEVTVLGAEDVDHVAWHAPPFTDQAVAATFQAEEDAAVGTVRRQAFGRIYRDLL
jgi:hypothetical protein